jgi:hypothetical protein
MRHFSERCGGRLHASTSAECFIDLARMGTSPSGEVVGCTRVYALEADFE